MGSRYHLLCLQLCAVAVTITLATTIAHSQAGACTSGPCVATYHNDGMRDGVNSKESILSPSLFPVYGSRELRSPDSSNWRSHRGRRWIDLCPTALSFRRSNGFYLSLPGNAKHCSGRHSEQFGICLYVELCPDYNRIHIQANPVLDAQHEPARRVCNSIYCPPIQS